MTKNNKIIAEQETVERYGGKVVIVPRIKGYSTTNTIKKLDEWWKWKIKNDKQ